MPLQDIVAAGAVHACISADLLTALQAPYNATSAFRASAAADPSALCGCGSMQQDACRREFLQVRALWQTAQVLGSDGVLGDLPALGQLPGGQ